MKQLPGVEGGSGEAASMEANEGGQGSGEGRGRGQEQVWSDHLEKIRRCLNMRCVFHDFCTII